MSRNHLVQRDTFVCVAADLCDTIRLVKAVRLDVPGGPFVFELRRDVRGVDHGLQNTDEARCTAYDCEEEIRRLHVQEYSRLLRWNGK